MGIGNYMAGCIIDQEFLGDRMQRSDIEKC